jgi:lipoprotein-anchoring transpeptidase ErfK/SrfK
MSRRNPFLNYATMWVTVRASLLMLLMVCLAAAGMIVSRSHSGDTASLRLVVDLSERELQVLEDGDVVRTYGVAVGSRKHPTPTGTFRTGRIQWNPGWVPPPSNWARRLRARMAGDPRNPMQGVKIYFREPWFYIHGTNDPGSIGTASSHGCIRMRTSDAKGLARRISKHGSVVLVIEE